MSDTNEKKSKRFSSNKIVKWLWISFLGFGLIVVLLLLLIYNGVIGYMPPIEELEDPHDKLASVVYASDGTTELGRYFEGAGNRVYNDYDAVSPHVIDALIATEDARYLQHSGVDFMALGRTVVKTLMLRDKSSGGGSTITQQLAKQLYSRPSSNMFKRALQKPIEWMIAIKLERFYTKDEIINMYLNRFDFLNNAVGIKTAANVYFGKEPDQLTVNEAAMLVGMLKNPAYYNPLRHPERTLNRRNTVLDQMVKAGKLSASEAEVLKAQPLGLDYHKVDHREGGAPYLREEIRRMMTAKKPERPKRSDYSSQLSYNLAYGNYTTDSTLWEDNPLYGWILKNPKPDGSYYDLYTDGLRIYSTIDMSMQTYAEEAVWQHLGGVLQPAFERERRGKATGPYSVGADLSTEGAMKLIKQAMKQTDRWRTMKSAGKSDAEIENSFREKYQMDVFCYVRENGKIVPGTKTVTMTPYDSLLYMKSILRTGMMSMDPVTGYVKAYVGGPDFTFFQYDMVSRGKRQVGSTAKPYLYAMAFEQDYDPCSRMSNTQPNFGGWKPRGSGGGGMIDLRYALTTSNNWISARLINEMKVPNFVNKLRMYGISGYLIPNHTLSLGSFDASVREMVGGYSTFANKGIRVDPVFVTRIEDNQGNVIFSPSAHRTEALSEQGAYRITDVLFDVVNKGTGRGIRSSYGLTAQMGGKTGTTNANADAWFMGFTPELVTGVWVGGEERNIRFASGAIGQGAKAALPIFALYMKKVYADPKLPYKQDTKFEFPEDFTPCERGTGYGGGPRTSEAFVMTESTEGIFD